MQSAPPGLAITMFRHRRAVFSVFFGIMLCAVAYLLIATPKYESVAQLIVRFGDRSVPEVSRTPVTEITQQDRHEIVMANAAMLDSHDLAQKTIEAIGLGTIYPDIVDDPPTRWTPMDEGVKEFLKALSVDVGTQDNIITVSFMHPDKQLAHDVVQKLISLYIAQQTEVYQNGQSKFMAGEVKDAGTRLSKAQAELEAFKGKWHITDYDQEVQDLLSQRGDVDTSLRNAEASLELARTKQKDLDQLIKQVPKSQAEPAGGEKYRSIDDAESKLADLRTKQSQMLATYSPDSPALSALNASIARAQADVNERRAEVNGRNSSSPNTVYQTLQTDYLRTQADADSNAEPVKILTGQLQEIDQRLKDLQQNRAQFNDLTREQQIDEETYRTLSTQYEDARVKDNLNQQRISPATIISQPTLPYKSARPRKLITLAASLFAATILAVATALFLEGRNDRFVTAEQVALILDLPVLASFDRHERPLVRGLLTSGAPQGAPQ